METTRYRLAAYIRVDPEDGELMTLTEVLAEKEQQEFLFPENLYRIEEIEPASADRKETTRCYSP